MYKKYNIIDKNILIDIPLKYDESKEFNQFVSNFNNEYDIKFNFIQLKNIIERDSKVLFKENFIKGYKEKEGYIREFYSEYQLEPYGFMNEKITNKQCNVFLYPSAKDIVLTTKKVFDMIGIESYFYKENTFILHSSYIKWNNKAILFSGPSGIGKSTQASLWQDSEMAEIINGDRCAINKKNGEWYAYGLPYAGSSKVYKNTTTPILAVVILNQGKENTLIKLDYINAFKSMYRQTTINIWNDEFIDIITKLLEKFIMQVPVYMLTCKPNYTAVEILKRELEGSKSWGVI